MSFKNLQFCLFAFLTIITLIAAHAAAAEDGIRAIIVEGIENRNQSANIRVAVDHANHIYELDDVVKTTVRSSVKGFLYLFYVHADGEAAVLFPNEHQTDNEIPARKDIQIPGDGAGFRLRVSPPIGKGIVKAILTRAPLKSLDIDSLIERKVTILTPKDVKAIRVEAANDNLLLAEHMIEFTTVAADSGLRDTSDVERFLLSIGISNYQSAGIPDLAVCHTDAQTVAVKIQNRCHLNAEPLVLINEQATLKNIEAAIRKLAAMSKPGDEIIIYWSGHGARCSDEKDNKDEKDGYDELLVTYDGDPSNIHSVRRTMLTDDRFGRLLQCLDGRRILVILDTCHSGGQAENEKGIGKAFFIPGISPAVEGEFDFLDGEIERLKKDIKQDQAAVLCSSRAKQISFLRKEKDLSVMTYYFCKFLDEELGRQGTVQELFAYLEKTVPVYTKNKFSVIQTPVLIGDTKLKFVVRQR